MKRFAAGFVKFDRSDAAAFEHLTEIVERRNEVAHRFAEVRLEVAASDDALFGMKIDQDQGPLDERRDARYDWARPDTLADTGCRTIRARVEKRRSSVIAEPVRDGAALGRWPSCARGRRNRTSARTNRPSHRARPLRAGRGLEQIGIDATRLERTTRAGAQPGDADRTPQRAPEAAAPSRSHIARHAHLLPRAEAKIEGYNFEGMHWRHR